MVSRWIVVTLALLSATGCYTISYDTGLRGSGQYREDRGDFFLWGLVGDETFDLRTACPQGVSRWKSEQTFVDGLIGVVTLGIYIPRHVKIECAGGQAFRLDPSDGRWRRLVSMTGAPFEEGWR